MDLNEAFLYEVREEVEKRTTRPAYMSTDEEWTEAVDSVIDKRKEAGLENPSPRVFCPHCGSQAPYGDERNLWISAHLDSCLHRWWWRLKAKGL